VVAPPDPVIAQNTTTRMISRAIRTGWKTSVDPVCVLARETRQPPCDQFKPPSACLYTRNAVASTLFLISVEICWQSALTGDKANGRPGLIQNTGQSGPRDSMEASTGLTGRMLGSKLWESLAREISRLTIVTKSEDPDSNFGRNACVMIQRRHRVMNMPGGGRKRRGIIFYFEHQSSTTRKNRKEMERPGKYCRQRDHIVRHFDDDTEKLDPMACRR